MNKRTKKYFAVIPVLDRLGVTAYKADTTQLECRERKTRFPVTNMIKKTAGENDEIEIIALLIKKPEGSLKGDDITERNYRWFKDEIEELKASGAFKDYKLHEIETPDKEDLDTQMKLLNDYIDCIGDNEDLYACITYGTKPTPIVVFLALNCGYKLRKNTRVKNIIYGRYIHDEPDSSDVKSTIYDITALFMANSIIGRLEEGKVENPVETLKLLLGMQN